MRSLVLNCIELEPSLFVLINKLLSKWLSGETIPANQNTIKIGNRFGKEIYDLMEWERPE